MEARRRSGAGGREAFDFGRAEEKGPVASSRRERLRGSVRTTPSLVRATPPVPYGGREIRARAGGEGGRAGVVSLN